MKQIDRITQLVADNFRTMGGGRCTPGNPLSYAMTDQPPQFALGVDVREVVEFVLKESKRKPKKATRP